MAVSAQLRSVGANADRQAAAIAIEAALAVADPALRLGHGPGWMLPDLDALKCQRIGGNFVFWDEVKPEIKIAGTGNVVVLGKVQSGNLRGAIDGNQNTVIVGGGVSRFDLRCDMRANDGLIFVGPRTKVISAHIVMGEFGLPSSVLIGGESLLSRLVTMRATNSHAIIDIHTGDVIHTPPRIVVEPHVWVGEGATLLKGSRVGFGSIVAAGALVTGAIPPCVTCAGIPAKIIRAGASWTFKLNPTRAEVEEMLVFLKTLGKEGLLF